MATNLNSKTNNIVKNNNASTIKKTATKSNVAKTRTNSSKNTATQRKNKIPAYLQNRELSWLKFNERVLDQGANKDNPLLERMKFVSIFSSNLKEFFMVRVGSLTDLSLVKKPVYDNKSGMTPRQQINAINKECKRLYPIQEKIFETINSNLAKKGLRFLRGRDFSDNQKKFLKKYAEDNIMPFLSPQIINAQHPFPHLENGEIYVVVRLADEEVTLGIIPLPNRCERIIKLPSNKENEKSGNVSYTLLEQVIEFIAPSVFNMYRVKHTNIICVTRNADLDPLEGADEVGEDFREHMKKILKKRTRLTPVRLESEQPLSKTVKAELKKRLHLREDQIYQTFVPLNMDYGFELSNMLDDKHASKLKFKPFTPQWPAQINEKKSFMNQILRQDFLLNYPYNSFDPMVKLVREAARDPKVVSIRITLYRLAKHSRLAEALIRAAEAGKDVTALFELRARFDENNNIMWSQRFEEAGAKVLYGFQQYKVHSKVCAIVRKKGNGKIERITQFGTGNYNESTAGLYTDFSYFTANEKLGKDAEEFFRNMQLENISDNYKYMCVAPKQIKQMIIKNINEQIELNKEGKPNGLFFKTNSLTDMDIIKAIVKASKAGVKTTILCRGICCLLPNIKRYTENVEVVSIVGRLLEHSRIYGFGESADMKIYCASADLMTRNMDKRVEVAWPILNETLRLQVIEYIYTCLLDTAKLRHLNSDGSYTIAEGNMDSQEELIKSAYHGKNRQKKLNKSSMSEKSKRATRKERKLVKKQARKEHKFEIKNKKKQKQKLNNKKNKNIKRVFVFRKK